MENNPIYYPDLVLKYLSGEITEDEILIFNKWLTSAPENHKLYEELRNTWVLIERSKADTTLDVEAEWHDFTERIKESRKMEDGRWKMEVGSWNSESKTSGEFLAGRQKHGNDRNIFVFRWAFRIAAVFLLIILPSFLLFRYFSKSERKVITAQDQMVVTDLPDGTSVSLNKGTTLEFSENFKGSRREVKLVGEACFSVKHDEKSRFVIVSGNVRIEDIGTSFYVNTNKSAGQMEVVLTEGQASIYFQDNPTGQVVINPGERVDINPSGNSIQKSINLDENFMAWKTKKFVFSNNTLPEVVALLNKVYQSDIRLPGNSLNNCRLSATFDNQSLESVLNVISSTLDVSIISKGLYIEISGNTCD
jgi:transmembrane sensor